MQGELYLVDESGQDVCFRIELPSSKTRNNANSPSHQAILFVSSARAVLEIFTYDMYAPVSPRCPYPNCLQQLRPLG